MSEKNIQVRDGEFIQGGVMGLASAGVTTLEKGHIAMSGPDGKIEPGADKAGGYRVIGIAEDTAAPSFSAEVQNTVNVRRNKAFLLRNSAMNPITISNSIAYLEDSETVCAGAGSINDIAVGLVVGRQGNYVWVEIENRSSGSGSGSGNTIVLIGDSVTDACEVVVSGIYRTQRCGAYYGWAQAFLYQRFNVLNIAGVGGESLPEIAARIYSDAIAYKPKYCLVAGGVNGIGYLTAIESINGLQVIIDALKSADIIPIIINPFLSDSFTTSDNNAHWHDINRWLLMQCDVLGFFYIDVVKNYIDTTSDYPNPQAGTTNDGTHLDYTGAYIVGRTLAEKLALIVPSSPEKRFITNSDSNCLSINPLMLGTGGYKGSGITGDLADDWHAEATSAVAVMSKVSRDSFGEWQRIDLTPSSDNGYVKVRRRGSDDATAYIGNTIRGFCEVQMNSVGSTAALGLWLIVVIFDASYTKLLELRGLFSQTGTNSLNTAFKANETFLLSTCSCAIPANAAHAEIAIYFSGLNGDNGVIDIGPCGIRIED